MLVIEKRYTKYKAALMMTGLFVASLMSSAGILSAIDPKVEATDQNVKVSMAEPKKEDAAKQPTEADATTSPEPSTPLQALPTEVSSGQSQPKAQPEPQVAPQPAAPEEQPQPTAPPAEPAAEAAPEDDHEQSDNSGVLGGIISLLFRD